MSTVTTAAKNRLVLYGEPWETCLRLLHLFDERRHVRITYDRGALEIMTTSPDHERCKHLLGLMVVELTRGLRLPIASLGSMTMKRRRKQKGLEPDECFWFKNEARVRGLTKFDVRRDPPPDLVVEVDISRSSLNRLAIYAALSVPEVWRFDGQTLMFHLLGANGRSTESDSSLAFPGVKAADLAGFLALRGQLEENELFRRFQAWVRQLPPAAGSASPPPSP